MASYTYRSSTYEYYRHMRREVGRMAEDKIGDQTVVQQPSGTGELVVTTFFRGVSARELFRQWISPELITQWWPQQAEIDARDGGEYHLSWPSMDWDLRGTYTAYNPGSRLAFTWAWDNEPETPTRQVDVILEPVGDIGTQLMLTHGMYTESTKDQEERQGHLEGWTYFLARLHNALS
ncbi:MAG: SRPBCC domain-containing protein [Chloroflexia bacterium]